MIILLKNKYTIKIDSFIFKCSIGRNGISKFKKEGDFKTPRGTFQLENYIIVKIERKTYN